MKNFVLSTVSRSNLKGVHPDLVKIVELAILKTGVDFKVTEGLRSRQRQTELVKAGASQTMNSRHLTGHAVDLAAWVGGTVRWDWPLYYKIAEAMRDASIELNIPLEWGGCWSKPMNAYAAPLSHSKLSITEKASQDYIAERQQTGRSAFIDGPHFQLPVRNYS